MAWFWGTNDDGKMEQQDQDRSDNPHDNDDTEDFRQQFQSPKTKIDTSLQSNGCSISSSNDQKETGDVEENFLMDSINIGNNESHSHSDDDGDNEEEEDQAGVLSKASSVDKDDEDDDFASEDGDDDDENSLHSLTTEEGDLSFVGSEDVQSMGHDDSDDDESSIAGHGHDERHSREHIECTTAAETPTSADGINSRLDRKKMTGIQQNEDTRTETSDDDDDGQIPSSFWEKQGLLVLAAEHDRVDILNAVLKDDDGDKERLMNTGIPPLHLAISFSSVNTAIALLRMGADPSVRPNVQEILEEQKSRPDDSKVDVPNVKRFNGASAWELAFGNAAYERFKSKKSKSWSLFGGSSSDNDDGNDSPSSEEDKTPIIKPADMPPSKREGIRHAFTAEALRCVGADEVDRLMELVRSGMPATIDIGGKDLYEWTVEMGALKCEEALRPIQASKYAANENDGESGPSSAVDQVQVVGSTAVDEDNINVCRSFKIHRPMKETVPQLRNRLDELESLAGALSTCLDNLAEEVSVCHGLLLLGGGATALASHVKSLKLLKKQKLEQLAESREECLQAERELVDLALSSGKVGEDILDISTSKLDFHFMRRDDESRINFNDKNEPTADDEHESEDEKRDLLAQIAATEHKTRKLRASIADLSEENARDMAEVERRGLEGGINLVRGIREELRDVDFQLSEIRSVMTTYKAKISMIHAQVPSMPITSDIEHVPYPTPDSDVDVPLANGETIHDDSLVSHEVDDCAPISDKRNHARHDVLAGNKAKTASERIATGDSNAIQVIRPGQHGFFPLDLWQVLLRIIGFERAAYRRGIQQQQSRNSRPETFIV